MKMNQKKEKKITNKANKKRYTVSESSYNNRAYVNKKDIFFMCTEKKNVTKEMKRISRRHAIKRTLGQLT